MNLFHLFVGKRERERESNRENKRAVLELVVELISSKSKIRWVEIEFGFVSDNPFKKPQHVSFRFMYLYKKK